MPEGDTLRRVAERLRPALAGAHLVRFAAPRLAGGPRPRPGERVDGVEARGKHLLITFAGGVVLRTHLGMTGSWHLYRRDERWRRPAHLARAVVEVDTGWVAVCFAAPVVRTFQPRGPIAPGPLQHLGPDLCDDAPDFDDVVRRSATVPDHDVAICEALLDQRVAAGMGNVYKSEVLWACEVHPLVPLAALDDATRLRLYATGHRLLRANLGGGRRVTHATTQSGLAVYGRRGKPCPRCGTPIERRLLGRPPRSTYWCPRCQPAPLQVGAAAPAPPARPRH